MRLVKVDSLDEVMTLAKPIYRSDERILLNVGCHNLPEYKDKLTELGINYIYVNDDKSKDIEVNDVITEQTRLKSKKIVHDTIKNVSLNREINVNAIQNAIVDMIDDILNNKNVLLNLTDIRSCDSYTFSHSVNVAVLSLVIGRVLQYNEEKLIKLGTGALLHDIGKALIPIEILNKPGKFTNEEFKIMQNHPVLGYDLVKDNYDLSPLSKTIILAHHEKYDGSGYPRGIQKDKIHEFARIAAVADVFDALTSNRCYRKKWPVYEAVEFLMSYSNTHFDKNVVEAFIRNVATFQNGTTVKLSNGQKALIKEQNAGFPARPIITIIEEADGNPINNPITINLINNLSLVIVESE